MEIITLELRVYETNHLPTQSIIWPGLEPVDGTAVDQRGELPHAATESISNWAECQNDVELLTTPVHKVGEERERGVFCIPVLGLGQWTHCLHGDDVMMTSLRVT